MRLGIIDRGTNSVRFDIHQIGPGKQVKRLHREKLMVRLGQGLFTDGRLDKNAIARTLHAFTSFKRTASQIGTDRITAFATSALREAADGEVLLSRIRQATGIDVRVISGHEEARLIARGILANETKLKGRFALVDIGGGSTEISICEGSKVLFAHSFDLGTARLQQIFLKSSPPRRSKSTDPHPVSQLRQYIWDELDAVLKNKLKRDARKVVGSSGTIRALTKILQKSTKSKSDLTAKALGHLTRHMSTLTTSQLLGIPGMEAKRVDMILAGAVLLDEVMDYLGAKSARTTTYALRDGILDEETRVVQQKKVTQLAFHLEDLFRIATRLGSRPGHMRQVAALAEGLFKKLQKVHGLRPEWRAYLTAAAYLHDVGDAINPSFHEAHSYYTVMNADLPVMETWEREFIATLCLYHNAEKIDSADVPFRSHPARRNAFLKILAIFQLADALDRNHQSLVTIKRIKFERGKIVIFVSGKTAVNLEILRVEQKRSIFEKVFRKEVSVARVSE
ncbi:MAG: HD domain-containing protein [Bacteriovoracia bacterium]